MTTSAYLNGSFLPLQEARVSVLDRGFLFADGVYEVVPVYGGRPFRLSEHLQRLDRSLQAIRLDNPLSETQWSEMVSQLLGLGEKVEQMLYIQVTRGASDKRSHALPGEPSPTVLAFCQPLPPMPDKVRDHGVAAITLADSRWLHCDVKSIALLGNVLLSQQALDKDCNEAILLRDGHLTEGASSNVFIVKNAVIATPPKSPELLPGITRDLILSLADQAGLRSEERPIGDAELLTADEILISSSTREIYPVTNLDGEAVGHGRPGPVWQQLYDAFQGFKNDYAQAR